MASINNLVPKASGYCVLCSSKASLACHRCGDFYCTKKCQLKDWQSHRYICFSIPPLVRPMECSVYCEDNTTPETETAEISTLTTANNCFAASTKDVISEAAKSCVSAAATNIKPEINAQLAQETKAATPILNGKMKECDTRHYSIRTLNNIAAAKPQTDHNNDSISNNAIFQKIPIHLLTIRPSEADMPSKNSAVYVVGFRTPNRCFIRDASPTADKAYSHVCEMVNLLGKKQSATRKPINFGYALADHNGLIQRVKVVNAKKKNIGQLHFIDLGFLCARNGAELREISLELLQLPCHILEVQIMNVANYALNDRINQFLKQFIGGKFILSYVSNSNVELLNVETRKSMNELIREFCLNMQVFDNNSTTRPQPGKIIEERKTSENANEVLVNQFKNTANSKTKEDQIDEMMSATKIALFDSTQIKSTSSESKQNTFNEASKEVICNEDLAEKKTCENPMEATIEALKNEIAAKKNPFKTTVEQPVQASVSKTDSPIKINQTAIAKNNMSEPSVEPVLVSPFEMKRLSSNADGGLDIFIVDKSNVSRGIFGAFDMSYAADFSKVHTYLSEFKDSQPYTPVVKEYVIAKFENGWFRAKVVDIKQNQHDLECNVMYLEFAKVGTVTVKDIRRYPADLTVPCHTNVCLLEGFPHKPSKEQINFLQDKLQLHSHLHVDSVHYNYDMAFVKCKTLLDELMKL